MVFSVCTDLSSNNGASRHGVCVQSTLRITTLVGHQKSVIIHEVSSYPNLSPSLMICIQVRLDFALGMEILSLFANCR